jgi:hypothetical protein
LHENIIEKNGFDNMNKMEIKKKQIMTLDEHRELGKILLDARNSLVVISVEIDTKYGKTKRLGMNLERAIRLIDKVRSLLDDRLFNEYPNLEIKEGCKYYY